MLAKIYAQDRDASFTHPDWHTYSKQKAGTLRRTMIVTPSWPLALTPRTIGTSRSNSSTVERSSSVIRRHRSRQPVRKIEMDFEKTATYED